MITLLTAKEAAKMMGVSERTFYRRKIKPAAVNTSGQAVGWDEKTIKEEMNK